MILYRYIIRELLVTFVGVASVLFLIFLGGLLIRFLPEVSTGSIPLEMFLPIIGVRILEELIVGIPLAFFLALIISIGRMFADSELIAAYACGLQRSKLMAIALVIAVLSALLVGMVSIVIAPLADQRYQEIMAEIEERSELNKIVAGRFVETSGGGLIYAESGDNIGGLDQVSIFDNTPTEYSVITAKKLTEDRGSSSGKQIVFHDGVKTTLSKENNEVQKTEFDEYVIQIKKKVVAPAHSIYALPVSVLWGSDNPSYMAELQWRISIPLMMIVLAVVAVAISRYTPRAGKYGRLLIAIVIYMLYSHFIMSSKVAIARETLPPVIGMWWVHLLLISIFISLFIYQERRAG